jgi:hypothetical protein
MPLAYKDGVYGNYINGKFIDMEEVEGKMCCTYGELIAYASDNMLVENKLIIKYYPTPLKMMWVHGCLFTIYENYVNLHLFEILCFDFCNVIDIIYYDNYTDYQLIYAKKDGLYLNDDRILDEFKIKYIWFDLRDRYIYFMTEENCMYVYDYIGDYWKEIHNFEHIYALDHDLINYDGLLILATPFSITTVEHSKSIRDITNINYNDSSVLITYDDISFIADIGRVGRRAQEFDGELSRPINIKSARAV